jgi:CubicO group peptidase (beta-lactamase class C family)
MGPRAIRTAILMLLAASAAREGQVESEVDAYLQEQVQKRRLPGLSVAVVKGGAVAFARGYGRANLELSAPATPETVYELASVSKQFTSAAVMLLVEEGKLGLDDPIVKTLPGLPEAWGDITVRNLLNHTSISVAMTYDRMLSGWTAPRGTPADHGGGQSRQSGHASFLLPPVDPGVTPPHRRCH